MKIDGCCMVAIFATVGNVITWGVVFRSNVRSRGNGREIIIGETTKLQEVDVELKRDVESLNKQLGELKTIMEKK